MMTILAVLGLVAIAAILLALVDMNPSLQKLFVALVAITVCVWLLAAFGIISMPAAFRFR